MASYLHTCSSCGVEMTVHDRYYGRTLRCTGCRAEFVADPAEPGGPPAPGRVPPTASHTCTACGATMTISERYYGRNLRCTACGEIFVARLPMAPAPVQQPPTSVEPVAPVPPSQPTAPAAPPDPAARSRRVRVAVVVGVIAVALGALLWWLGGNREQGFGSSLFASEKQRMQIGELRFGDEILSAEYAGILAQAAVNRGLAPARLFIGNALSDAESAEKDMLHLIVKLEPAAGTIAGTQ
jgi:predicted RNA-binding Zn-ribbon protein involved in translation (DUF1610 family)